MMFAGLCVLILLQLKVDFALNPVVLVPGLGANHLEAKLDKKISEHFWCWKHSDWYTIWLSFRQLEFATCMEENMMLVVNESDGSTANRQGVSIRVPGFGNTDTVEWLTPFHPFSEKHLGYYVTLVERLLRMNYVRKVSVRGAPYDFRKAPNELADYMADLTGLIEETFAMNGNQWVVIVGHSLGGNVALYFLQNKDDDWKDKYISASFAGAAKVVKAVVSGETMGFPKVMVNPLAVRRMQRTMSTIIWSMALEDLWGEKEVLIETPFRNCTAADYDQLFRDIGYDVGILVRKNTRHLLQLRRPPGVRTYCIYSTYDEPRTPARFIYASKKANWFDHDPLTILGPGDGTVDQRSLEACRDWPGVEVVRLSDIEHRWTVSDGRVVDLIESILRDLAR